MFQCQTLLLVVEPEGVTRVRSCGACKCIFVSYSALSPYHQSTPTSPTARISPHQSLCVVRLRTNSVCTAQPLQLPKPPVSLTLCTRQIETDPALTSPAYTYNSHSRPSFLLYCPTSPTACITHFPLYIESPPEPSPAVLLLLNHYRGAGMSS